ncbi:hypothetical protein A3C99_03390 [Candidatus Daviesbacteria bacterium RIFCSPHIGHO2_02_FULL_37_9]|nr:MAG: hypothetical protein A3C99_03390 [Candidatus Daviesbacteria bacterium RIFCSPHIGHO2_02_FULL_37_9]
MFKAKIMAEDSFKKLFSFYSQFKTVNYKRGDIILSPGQVPPGVYFLKRGYTRLYSVSQEGEDLTMIIYKPNDFFPFMWTINQTPNIYYLEALTNTELGIAPRKEFLAFLKENVDLAYELTSRILLRFEGLLERMEHLVFGNAYNKVAMVLSLSAQRFGKKQEDNSIHIPLPLTHKDIASLTGLTRETVSIEMKKLEREGIITHTGRQLTVCSLPKVKHAAMLNSSSAKAKLG